MTIRNQNVIIYRGDSTMIDIAVTQEDGTPYDPATGAQFKYRVAETSHEDEVDVLISKSSDPSGGITPIIGGVEVVITTADTTAFDPGIYYHELKLFDGVDEATTMVGAFIVRPSLLMS